MPGTPDLVKAYRELLDAREAIGEADAFYDGEVGDTFASPKVRKLLTKAETDKIRDFNYSMIPVNVVANKLEVQSVGVAPVTELLTDSDDPTPEGEDAVKRAEQAIEELRTRNQLAAEEKGLHHKVSKHGDAYLLVWPVVDGETGAVETVDMLVNSAYSVRVIYDPEHPLRKQYAIKSWDEPGADGDKKVTRANLYYPDRVERWVTKPGLDGEDAKSWERYTKNLPGGVEVNDKGDIVNLCGEVPFFHFRNDRPYGVPEHRNAYGPQQLINKLVVSHAVTIEFQSFPQRYYLVDPMSDDPHANQIDPFDSDEDLTDPDGDAQDGSALAADPSAVWRLYARSVGQFEPANPDIFLRPFDRYIKSMAELTDTPQHAFTKATGDIPSGAAVRELNGPTTAKVGDRQDRYGPEWSSGYELALELLGITGVTVTVRWAPAMQVQDNDGWSVVEAKIRNGVPPEVALQETGYSAEEVKQWTNDADGSGLVQRLAMMTQFGALIQSLGAGVGLNVISADQAQKAATWLLGDIAAGDDDSLIEGAELPDPDPPKPPVPPQLPPGPAPQGQPPDGGLQRGNPAANPPA